VKFLGKRGTYGRLLVAILLSLVAQPLLALHFGHPRWFGLAFFMLVLLAALEAAQAARRTRRIAWTLALVAIVTSWLYLASQEASLDDRHPWIESLLAIINHTTSMVFLAFVVAMLVRRTLAPGTITGARIVAAICTYLLLGILWGEAYRSLEVAYGGVLSTGAATTDVEFTYFSFTTLTTLGYGDITPVHTSARVLAYLEAVTGVLYLATLVARLVALHIAHEQLDQVRQAVEERGNEDS